MTITHEQLADALDAFHNAALGCASARAADSQTFDTVAAVVDGFNAIAAQLRKQAEAAKPQHGWDLAPTSAGDFTPEQMPPANRAEKMRMVLERLVIFTRSHTADSIAGRISLVDDMGATKAGINAALAELLTC